MLKFFRKKSAPDKPVPCLILDIGTEFIKALVVESNPKSKAVVVRGVGKQRCGLQDTQAGSILDIQSVINNCELAIQEAENQANMRPLQMLMGIGGELVKGKFTILNYTRENPTKPIDLTELKNIVHKAQWQAFDQARAELALETGHTEIEIKLVNAVITRVTIDGQMATNPLGFQGKKISLQVFNAFAPLTHFGALQTVAAELDRTLLGMLTQTYALSRALTGQDTADSAGIFIDIGGGTTDLAVVQGDSLVGMKTFAIGGRTLTKRLAASLNLSFREAEKIKLTYAKHELDKDSNKIVGELLTTDLQVWLTGVELALKDFDTLPSKIYLSGGTSDLPALKHALESKTWQKRLAFAKTPRVQHLEPSDFEHVQDATGSAKSHQFLVPLALASLSAEFVGEEEALSRIMRNMTSLIQH